jgi:single-stranded DNA-binding protein
MNELTITGQFDREPDQRTIDRPTGAIELTRASLNFLAKRGDKDIKMWIDVEAVGNKAHELASVPLNTDVTIKGRIERAAWQDKQTGEWRAKHFIRYESAEHSGAEKASEDYDDIPF